MEPNQYTHLLRIEAVNFAYFIFDNNDLSTTRGGGLLLLQAVVDVEEALGAVASRTAGKAAITTLSRGASVGLFAIDCGEANDAGDVIARQFLAAAVATIGKDPFCHATFSVDCIRRHGARGTDDHFRADVESLIALNRRSQMHSPSLRLPLPGNIPCEIDRIRPAADDKRSASVNARRKYGLDMKQKFYQPILERAAKNSGPHNDQQLADQLLRQYPGTAIRLANDFSEIAGKPPAPYEQLTGKLAVFYADGNHFSNFNRATKAQDLLISQ